MSAIQLRKQTKLVREYWSEVCSKEELVSSPMNSSFYESVTRQSQTRLNNAALNSSGQVYLQSPLLNPALPKTTVGLQPLYTSYENNINIRLFRGLAVKENRLSSLLKNNLSSMGNVDVKLWANEIEYIELPETQSAVNYNVTNTAMFEDSSRFFKRKEGLSNPLTIRPVYISDSSVMEIKNSNLNLLTTRYETGVNEIVPKPKPHNNFMVMKQKRYKRRKTIKSTEYVLGEKALDYYKSRSNVSIKPKNKGQILLSRDNSLSYSQENLSRKYKLFMKNKTRGDDTNIAVSRRMIRTKRTLVLPAHVNLTAITNSYDVIHSWFIPGLGLKMDCIPGRSTHHTFYIDNVGFYYGQCAEVCGRYHHHMPIRICALPFNHFLLW